MAETEQVDKKDEDIRDDALSFKSQDELFKFISDMKKQQDDIMSTISKKDDETETKTDADEAENEDKEKEDKDLTDLDDFFDFRD